MEAVDFRVLGPLEIVDGGRAVEIGSAAQRRLLCVLLAQPGRTVSATTLTDAVWDGRPPASAATTLRALVSRLRKVVGDRLASRDGGYLVQPESCDVIDAERFTIALERARAVEAAVVGATPQGSPHASLHASLDASLHPSSPEVAELRATTGLWRGRAFGDLGDTPALRPFAKVLDRRRLDALELLARVALRSGRWDEAAALGREVVTADELREPAWTTLVLALARAGRGPQAVRAAAEAREALAELGLLAGPALQAAEAEALGIPSAPTRPAAPPRIPKPLTPTIGRDHERSAVLAALAEHRLVTLLGPGGVGKTRLALDVAAELAGVHSRGAIFVPLSRIGDGSDVAAAITASVADAVGLRGMNAGEISFDGVGALDAILVLDNCEHVIEAVSALAPSLLQGGDRLRVLATSREPLAVDGERIVAVRPLATDSRDAPAAELFRQRAAAAGAPEAEIADDALVTHVVRQLDGLPLALEMAAARLRSMSLGQLASSIPRGLDLLATSRRDVEQRHRTVRDLLAWSERLLDDEARRALFDFSVFAGGVKADDLGAAVSGPRPAEIVSRLVDRSMLLAVRGADGDVRFVALETVRSYGRERLAADATAQHAAHERHACWFRDAVAAVDRALRGDDVAGAFGRFGDIFDELRAAFRWAIDHDVELAVDIVHHANLVARMSLRLEVMTWATELVERLEQDGAQSSESFPVALAADAAGLSTRGRLADARAAALRSLTLAPAGRGALHALDGLADSYLYEGRLDDCVRVLGEARALADRWGDSLYRDVTIVGLALARVYGGDATQATAVLDTAGAAATAFGAMWFDYARGEATMDLDVPGALAHLDRAVDAAGAATCRYLLEVAMLSATTLRARAGEIGDAAARFDALLDQFTLGGDLGHLVTTLRNLVTLLERMGDAEASAELYGAVVDHPSSPSYGVELERLRSAARSAREALGDDGFARAVGRGRSRPIDAAVDAARAALAARRETTPATLAPRHETAAAALASSPDHGELRRRGDAWHIDFGGATAVVRHAKGLADLAILLARPGVEVHALELMGAADIGGPADTSIDAAAARDYRSRIVELQAEIDQATADYDTARASLAELELDALVGQLSSAFGLGGRRRTSASSAERARSAVTFRIRAAIRKIAVQHPLLGRHLDNAVRTGTWCSYWPERPTTWRIDPAVDASSALTRSD